MPERIGPEINLFQGKTNQPQRTQGDVARQKYLFWIMERLISDIFVRDVFQKIGGLAAERPAQRV